MKLEKKREKTTMAKEFNVAVAGATGAVGVEMIKTLEKRNFPVKNLKLLASARSAGKTLEYKGEKIVIEEMTYDSFKAYNAPIDGVLEALRQAGASVPTVLEEKAPFAAVKNYGDSAIEYVLQVWSTADDYWTTLFAVNQNIKVKFDEAGIEMTYPHLNVHLDK